MRIYIICTITALYFLLANCQQKKTNLLDKTTAPYSLRYELQFPVEFAQGELRTNNGICFSTNGKTLYTSKPTTKKFTNGKYYMGVYKNVYQNGKWIEKGIVDFQSNLDAYHPVLSIDNKTLFFNSRSHPDSLNRAIPHNIWVSTKANNGWSEPKMLNIVNSEYYDSYPSIAKSGNLYFNSDRPGGKGGMDIYVSYYSNGGYKKPINLIQINSSEVENDLVIDPDEKFIIFNRYIDRFKEIDLYISFKKNNNWIIPKPLNQLNKVSKWELTPTLSPDQKYFFYELDGKIMQIDLNQLFD